MGYSRSTYGRRGSYSGRRAASVTGGRVPRANQRPGDCRDCGAEIPAERGQLYRETSGAWSVIHVERTWKGSPVSGRWVGGCPSDTAKLNGADAPEPAEAEEPAEFPLPAAGAPREFYGYNSRGRNRCEDAPCCGCCD